MKQGLLFILFFILLVFRANSTTCPMTVELNTQAEVDAFIVCDTINGNLEITSSTMGMSDITSLAPLAGIKVVNGILMIRAVPALQSLEGLESITKVTQLMIETNQNLTDINALENLEITLRSIEINTNSSLSQCCALQSQVQNALFFTNDSKNLTGCNSAAEIISDMSCTAQAVPTIGQWAIIHLSLLLLIIGSLSLLEKPKTYLLSNNCERE